jgi:hydrogenase nickel incorporation protein HypA/HybF
MHEVSLALSLLEGVEAECAARGGLRVRAVHLRLGDHSGAQGEALRFAYEVACQGTALEGSRLVTETVAGTGMQIFALEVDP